MATRKPTSDEIFALTSFVDPAKATRILNECFRPSPLRERLLLQLEQLSDKIAERDRPPRPDQGRWSAWREAWRLESDIIGLRQDIQWQANHLVDLEHPRLPERILTSAPTQAGYALVKHSFGKLLSPLHTLLGGLLSWQQAKHKESQLEWAEAEIISQVKQNEVLRQRAGAAARGEGNAISPGTQQVEITIPVPIPYIIHQEASGDFHIQVVNKRRAAAGRAKGWSATLRGLEADRQRCLLDPTATDGPGTDAWKALMAQIIGAREGLRNAATELWDKPAADSLVDQKVAGALPWVAASVRRTAAVAPTSPVPLGPPAPEPTAPLALAPPSPMAPPPLDVAAICQAYQEGLTAGLGGSY